MRSSPLALVILSLGAVACKPHVDEATTVDGAVAPGRPDAARPLDAAAADQPVSPDADGVISPDAPASPETTAGVDARVDARDVAPDRPPTVPGPAAVRPVPTRDQAAYQRMERIAFFHFGPNTYTDSEFGDGNADPNVFDPGELDARQWMAVLKSAGFKLGMLTAKHHDGFCLWPTKCSEYSVAKSRWKNGQGDVIKEFTEAAKEAGIKVGLYLSPLSNHGADSSNQPGYFEKLKCMLTEVLTNYGEVTEVWFDGNLAPQGDWNEIVALVRRLQPRVVIQMGPEIAVMTADIRWVGNEAGIAPEGTASVQNRNNTLVWYPAECDVSIRPGWFHRSSQDGDVKSLDHLLDIYFKSIGRNCPLLLNLPPDQRGLIAEPDVTRMKEFGEALDEIFKLNLAEAQMASADSTFSDSPAYGAARAVDGDLATYWAAAAGETTGRLEIDLGAGKQVKVVSLQEPIELGERARRYRVEIQEEGSTEWTTVGEGTVIGARNLIRVDPPRSAARVALEIEQARGVPAIAEFAVY